MSLSSRLPSEMHWLSLGKLRLQKWQTEGWLRLHNEDLMRLWVGRKGNERMENVLNTEGFVIENQSISSLLLLILVR